MTKVEQIKILRDTTGCSLYNCRCAVDFSSTHNDCTPVGYLKAITLAVATPTLTFEERVQKFSKGD